MNPSCALKHKKSLIIGVTRATVDFYIPERYLDITTLFMIALELFVGIPL